MPQRLTLHKGNALQLKPYETANDKLFLESRKIDELDVLPKALLSTGANLNSKLNSPVIPVRSNTGRSVRLGNPSKYTKLSIDAFVGFNDTTSNANGLFCARQ